MVNLSQKQIYAFAGAIAVTIITYAFYKTIKRRATSVYSDIYIAGKSWTELHELMNSKVAIINVLFIFRYKKDWKSKYFQFISHGNLEASIYFG